MHSITMGTAKLNKINVNKQIRVVSVLPEQVAPLRQHPEKQAHSG